MKKAFRKLGSAGGFTLSETLIAVLILLMVVSIVGGAIPAASNSYIKAVDAANAQVLLSTAMTVLRDELNNAEDITVSATDHKTITYRSGETGRMAKIFPETKDGIETITVSAYGVENADGTVTYPANGIRQLVTRKAATKNLSITYSSAEKGDGVIIIKGLSVMRSGVAIASRESYSIRTLG